MDGANYNKAQVRCETPAAQRSDRALAALCVRHITDAGAAGARFRWCLTSGCCLGEAEHCHHARVLSAQYARGLDGWLPAGVSSSSLQIQPPTISNPGSGSAVTLCCISAKKIRCYPLFIRQSFAQEGSQTPSTPGPDGLREPTFVC